MLRAELSTVNSGHGKTYPRKSYHMVVIIMRPHKHVCSSVGFQTVQAGRQKHHEESRRLGKNGERTTQNSANDDLSWHQLRQASKETAWVRRAGSATC